MAMKSTCRKTARGTVMVSEASDDGRFIVLENTGYQEEKLGGWKIVRNIDGDDNVEYMLQKNFSIKVNSKIKIWAASKPPLAPRWDQVAEDLPTWGVGKVVKTTLRNVAGEMSGIRYLLIKGI